MVRKLRFAELPVRITYYPSDIIANPIPENDLKKFGVKEVSGTMRMEK